MEISRAWSYSLVKELTGCGAQQKGKKDELQADNTMIENWNKRNGELWNDK